MRLIYIFNIFFLLSNLYSQTIHNNFVWKSYTYKGEILDIEISDDKVWCVTQGGVFSADLNDRTTEEFTNTEGLIGINMVSVEADNEGNLWFSNKNKGFNIYNKKTAGWDKKIVDITGELIINDISIKDRTIYIANNKGISEYLIDKDEIKSNFKNLGEFSSSVRVSKVYIFDNTIWAITDEGPASANLDSPNLQDPIFWTNYTSFSEGETEITGLTEFQNQIYAASKKGVLKLENNKWKLVCSINPVHFISSGKDYIYFTQWSNLYYGNDIYNLEMQSFDCYKINFAKINNDTIFAGTSNRGLYVFYHGDTLNYMPDNPGGNSFNDFAVDNTGKLWCSSGIKSNKGIYSFYNGEWTNYSASELGGIGNFFVIEVDNFNRKWLGTPGNGLLIVDDDEGFNVTPIDHTSGLLTGSATPEFVIVEEIKKDSKGNMWLINNFANNGNALVCVTPEDDWYYFSDKDGLLSNILNTLTFDEQGRVWIGSRTRGIFVLNHKGTIENKSDDTWIYFDKNKLRSNTITALETAQDGTIWIGTPEGINYYSLGSISSIICPLSNDIQDFAIDGIDNLWVTTGKGVAVFNFNDYDWEIYTSGDSPLVDNNIFSILADKNNGIVYIGTNSGMTKIETPYKIPHTDYSNVVVYPNPFIIRNHDKVVIKNLTRFSFITVFTETGQLIRKIPYSSENVVGTEAYWDGKDKINQIVPSGIYLIAVADEYGNQKTFKIAVIR